MFILLLTTFSGCHFAAPKSRSAALSKCDRLEIWKGVLTASAFAKETGAVIKHETGRDEYQSIYIDHLTPTLKRFGLDRTEAFLIFEEEGGWPYSK